MVKLKKDTGNEVIPLKSEYEHLLEETRLLQERIIELTAIRDDLRYHICPALRAVYEEKIAMPERELLAAQMYLHEKQRIIEILQAQMNRQKQPSLKEAEEEAREESEAFKEDLKRKAKEAEDFRNFWENNTKWSAFDREEKERTQQEKNAAHEEERHRQDREKDKDFTGDSGSESGETGKTNDESREPEQEKSEEKKKQTPAQELKSLYRKIVKRLHPDVHPNPGEREKALLNEANMAYAAGDLERIRKIWEEVCENDPPGEQFRDTPEDIEKLKELVNKLKKRIHVLEVEISGIRSAFPYNMKAFLEDIEAVMKRRQELLERLARTREADRKLGEYIEELRRQMQEGCHSQ